MQSLTQLVNLPTITVLLLLTTLRTSRASLQFLGQPQFTAYVSNAAPPGTLLYTLTAINTTTHSRPDTITYTLVKGSYDSDLFELHTLTGELVNLQYLPLQSSVLQIQANVGTHSVQEDLTVIVEPEYKVLPVFEKDESSYRISEYTTVGSLFGVVRAFSLDPEVVGHSYSILSGNAGNDIAIDATTGVLTVARELDYETTRGYNLTVEYSDGVYQATVSARIEVLDENDNRPSFQEVMYEATVTEGALIGTSILTVSATDEDSMENSEIEYSVLGAAGRFEIDGESGEVTTTAMFDYETESEYRFTVVASDGGDPVLTSSVILLVRVLNEDDECPVFHSTYYSVTIPPESVPEEPGEVVATVRATDPDNIGTLTYYTLETIPALELDSNSGNITLIETTPYKYTFRVFVSDDGDCEDDASVSVVINVGSTNSHTPQFTAPCEASILEGSPTGTIVTNLQATDNDVGIYGRVTYAFVKENSVFSLDIVTGEVTVLDSDELDYEDEEKNAYLVDAVATDLSNRQAYCLLNITVLDVNDHVPQFLGAADSFAYEVRIPESSPEGTFVVKMIAEDADSGSNAAIEYEILPGQAAGNFTINPSSGVVTVANAALNQTQYTFAVRASNPNSVSPSSMSSTATVSVHVISDDVIAFNQTLYSATVCENLQFQTSVLQLFTNENQTVFFDLISGSEYSSNGEEVFETDVNGNVIVSSQATIDYERLQNSKFLFSVAAISFPGFTHSIATVEITLLDSDDNRPKFQSDRLQYTVSEDSAIGTTVGRITATDPDSGTNGEVAFSFSQTSAMFHITDSGYLVTDLVIDAEAEMTIPDILRVDAYNPNPIDIESCTSGPRPTATVVISVSTIDVNDNTPSFVGPTTKTLREDTPLHTTITTFSAIDADVSSEIRYSVTAGDINQNFMLTERGVLTLVQPLDHEDTPSITLTVQVSDGVNTNTTQFAVVVTDIDDEPPVFSQSFYSATITENAPLGETVLTVSTEDVDSDSVSYWLTGSAEGRFSISNTRVITVSGNIDREDFQSGNFSFAVVAEGGPLATADVTIVVTDVNDCVPRFPSIDEMIVPENVHPSPVGVEVGRVTAYDSDVGRNGEISYSLQSGTEDGFSIDATTGVITTDAMYNREEAPFYTLVVEAADMGEDVLSTVTTFQVKIGDENDNVPYFPYPYMYTRIFENSATSTEVFRLPAVDLDEGTNAELTFTLLSSQPNTSQIFELDQTTGAIRLARTLDYENPSERNFTLRFSVADSRNESAVHSTLEIAVLDRNDHTPVIEGTHTQLSLVIPEDTPEDTVILELTATDGDSGSNAQLVFAIASGDPDGDFVLRTSGDDAVVSIARPLDYERKSSYNLVLQVCDQGTPAACSTLQHIILIGNIDDVPPAFSQALYGGSVQENSAPVTSILQLTATDPDFEKSFEYKIESGNDDGRFSINSATGVLSSTATLDREEQETYTLVITAADEGGTLLSGTGTAVITVTDVDDNPPANESRWNVFMLLLGGSLPADQTILYYFNDSDTSTTFTDCNITESENNSESYFSIDTPSCRLQLNMGNTPENDYSIRVFESNYTIFSTVDIDVQHISPSDIPTEYLVTVSLATSSANYLASAYTSFPEVLSSVLGVDRHMITIVSVNSGYHDPTDTVDVSFLAKIGENSYLPPALILQSLYTQRERFQSMLGFELSALPTDPCSTEPCTSQSSCTSTKTVLGSSITATSPSFVLVAPVIKLDYECKCVPGTTGENCSINFDDCYSNPCHFDADCIDELNGYRCVCPPGTSGEDCSVSPDGCSSSPCQNGATCRDTPGSHSCLCLPGYYGPQCQYHHFRTSHTCDHSPCMNGGACSPGIDSFTCICPDTHSGPLCEIESEPEGCSGNPCYNGSTCTDSESGPLCSCSVGFTGPFCRWQIDNCELEPCLNGGTCATGLYGSYQCYCPPPYTGENCEEFVRGCESSPCQNGGRCYDISDSSAYTCECVRGYSGENCEYEVDPASLCSDDVNPCVVGNCTYGRNSYTCSCPEGYSGDRCEIEGLPNTTCGSNPCLHGGECIALSSSNYTCSCSPGFTGTQCEVNMDDCSSNPCINGICRDGISGYVCECDATQATGYNCDVWCPSGLTGDFCQNTTTRCDSTLCQNGGTCVEDGEKEEGYSCVCPPTHTGQACEQENTCDAVHCFNGGTCTVLEDGSYGCVCTEDFSGEKCQLLTVSFTESLSEPTYRAYPSLHLSAQGKIEFEFSTIDSGGLLLYNTQLQSGASRDFIAVEVVEGQLVVSVSRGDDTVSLRSDVWVSDGQWHTVTIEIAEKRTSLTLDWCHDLDEPTGTSAGCHITAETTGESSFLDLGLPLWLGGAPSPSPSHVSTTAITACVRQLLVNGDLLDLNSHTDQANSQPGCPQLEDKCSSGECGTGECIPTWTRSLCDCPPLLSGNLCDTGSLSVSYSGSGYAQYTLTDEGVRESRQTGGVLRSTYEDRISLTLRTTHTDGFLFGMYGETEAEYLHIVLESGHVVLHLSLSEHISETVLTVPSQQLSDSQRHTVSVHCSGTHLNLSLDSNSTLHSSLPVGSPLTLDTLSSLIYTGGSPFVSTSSWFRGCLRDVHINRVTLPATSAGNEFASVVYEGEGVSEGCVLSPCYMNPCGSDGVCEETGRDSYRCVCSGERVNGPCPQSREVVEFWPYVISGVIFLILLVALCVCLFVGVVVWRRRKQKRTYFVGDTEKTDGQELSELFAPSQAVVISNEQGGGEVDVSEIDWAPMAARCGSSAGKPSPQSSKSTRSKNSPATHSSNSRASGEKETRKKYQFRLPAPEREEVDGGEGEEEEEVRSNSPVIRAYLEERVDTANDEVRSVDSLRRFADEGSEDSEVDSLSSAYHSEEGEEEGYTLERLQAAGPPLSSLAPLLQNVLQSTAEISTRVSPSSTSDIMLTPYTTQ